MSIQQQKFKLIADKIREKTGTTDTIKPNDFVDKIDEVYTSGQESQQPIIKNLQNQLTDTEATVSYMRGLLEEWEEELVEVRREISDLGVDVDPGIEPISDAIPAVYEAGYQKGMTEGDSGYDWFWDTLQQSGSRTNYNGAFGGWHESIFKPKYDMKPTEAHYIFAAFQSETDMVELLKQCGVTLDFSDCRQFSNFMLWSKIKRMGVINSTKASSVSFYYAYFLETIDLLIIKNDGSTTLNFEGCNELKNIIIQGIIGKSTNMRDCPLSKESIISVVNALSQTTSNLTITFKKSAVNNAFGINVDDAKTYPEGSEFYNLRNSKSNWTFSYV